MSDDKQVIASEEVGNIEEVFGKNDSMFKGSKDAGQSVDLTGSQIEENETPEDFGFAEAAIQASIRLNESAAKDEAKAFDKALISPPEPIEPVLPAIKPKKDIPEELPIEFLYNPNNKKIFPVNAAIVKQKHLIPCTEDGKILPDTRIPSDFR